MIDVIALEKAAVLTDKIHAWYKDAQARARTQAQQDAAAIVYHAALLTAAVSGLQSEFTLILAEITKPEPLIWDSKRRTQLAEMVDDLSRRETRVNQLQQAMGLLDDPGRRPGKFQAWVRDLFGGDKSSENALANITQAGRVVIRMINAGGNAPTPRDVDDLARIIRDADTEQKVNAARLKASEVLEAIDRLTARDVHEAFGCLVSVLSREHGVSVPDWTSVV